MFYVLFSSLLLTKLLFSLVVAGLRYDLDGNILTFSWFVYRSHLIYTQFPLSFIFTYRTHSRTACHPAMKNYEELTEALIFANRVLGYLSAPVLMQHVIARLQGVCVKREESKERRDMFCDALQDFGYSFIRPKGAYYIFPETPGDDLVFTQELAKEGILVLPGKSFGRSRYIRIAFCVKKETIKKSLPGFKKVKDYFSRNPKGKFQ